MHEIWMDCLSTIFTIIITAIATALIKLLQVKVSRVSAKLKDDKKKSFLNWVANDVLVVCINATTQTFVQELKQGGEFTKERQQEAVQKTTEQLMTILTDANKKLLSTYVGDVESWVNTYIENHILNSKY